MMPYAYANDIRHEMWKELIPGYENMGKAKRREAKMDFAEALGKFPNEVHTKKEQEMRIAFSSISYPTSPECFAKGTLDDDMNLSYNPCYQTIKKNKEEDTMAKERDYLIDRLWSVRDNHYADLREQFFISVPFPKNMSEAIERIKTGDYIFDEKKHGQAGLWAFSDLIEWRRPTEVADPEGFAKAEIALEKAYRAAKDVINVLTPAEGLAALKEFQAFKYSA